MKSSLKGRIGLIALGALMVAGGAQAQQLTEGFENATFPPTGWVVRNQSTVIGGNATCWNRFFPPPGTGGNEPWGAQAGTGHAGANFNCTSAANTISGWFITPQLTQLHNGNIVTFFSRAGGTFADRLQLRLCLDTAPGSCGAAGSTGASATDVGQFTTLLVDVNPTLAPNGYPTTFTQFTATLSGLPNGFSAGRLAFRYFVTDGGPDGTNSNILSIDSFNLDNTSPVELMEFSIQ
jgi:hypothetical protein